MIIFRDIVERVGDILCVLCLGGVALTIVCASISFLGNLCSKLLKIGKSDE